MSIKKIAEIVGVSPSTVSRVINNPEHKCADEGIRAKIFETARRLGYTPNEAARNLKYGSEHSPKHLYIDVLVTRDASDPFFSQLVRTVEIQSLNQGFIILHMWHYSIFSDYTKLKQNDMNRILDEMFADFDMKSTGLMILGKCSKEGIDELKKRCKNIVTINRNSNNLSVDEVLCDGYKIANIAVEYLLSLGHRKIGYVGDSINESRLNGYQNVLFNYNINIDLSYIYGEKDGYDRGYAAAEYFMKHPNPPTAIYCSNDITALGVLNYLAKSKFRYYHPSVIASDDIKEAQLSKPMLTTVTIPKENMVRYALELLRDRMNGGHKDNIKIEFEGKLVIRESCFKAEEAIEIEYYI